MKNNILIADYGFSEMWKLYYVNILNYEEEEISEVVTFKTRKEFMEYLTKIS